MGTSAAALAPPASSGSAAPSPGEPSIAALIEHFPTWAHRTCRVADRTGRLVRFRENPMQFRVNQIEDEMRRELGYAWLYQLKMRRGGLSLNTQLRNLWRIWREPNVRGLTLAHTDESLSEIFELTRRAVDHFPQHLSPMKSRERLKAVTYPRMGSRFLTMTAGSVQIGRGADLAFLHISEYAFVSDPDALHTSASQALRANGTYIRETTASSFGSVAHDDWKKCRAGETKARAVFFPWWWRDDAYLPLLDLEELDPLTAEERDLAPQIADHQLWLDREYYRRPPEAGRIRRAVLEQLKWRRDKIRELGLAHFNQEYPRDDETCWLASGDPYFDRDALLWALQKTVREPIRREWAGALWIYAEPDPNRRYLLGADVSEGVKQDRSTLHVLDAETFEQCAVYGSRTCPPEELADRAAELGKRYASAKYGPAVIVPERNSMGHTTVHQLVKVIKYPLGRLWHQAKANRAAEEKRSDLPGWRTTEETKYLALNDGAELLRSAYASDRAILRDKETVTDLLAVQRGDDGKVSLTGHDHAVGWLLAYQGRKHPVLSGLPVTKPGAVTLTPAGAAVQRKH